MNEMKSLLSFSRYTDSTEQYITASKIMEIHLISKAG